LSSESKGRETSSQGASSGGFKSIRSSDSLFMKFNKLSITTKAQISVVIVSLIVMTSVTVLYSDFDHDELDNFREMKIGSDISKKDTSGDGIEDGVCYEYWMDPSQEHPQCFVDMFDEIRSIDKTATKKFTLTLCRDDRISNTERNFLVEYETFKDSYPEYFLNLSYALFDDFLLSADEICFLTDINHLTKDMIYKSDTIAARYLKDSLLRDKEMNYINFLEKNEFLRDAFMSEKGRLGPNEMDYLELVTDNPNNIRPQVLLYGYHRDGIINQHEYRNVSDPDRDGIITILENNINTDPMDPDSDGDGLLDGDEHWIYHTDPKKFDTDDDQISDKDEIVKYTTNPLKEDTDGDKLRDDEEILEFFSDPNVKDELLYEAKISLSRDDGQLDEIERDYLRLISKNERNTNSQIIEYDFHDDGIITLGELRNSKDEDSDGLIRAKEMAIGTDPKDKDTDKDGLLDGWEVYSFHRHGFEPVRLAEYGADPLHKDIFVEMIGNEKMSERTKEKIISAFQQAPVSNPDGIDGIDIHIDDDTPGYSLGGDNEDISEYYNRKVSKEHPRYGVFYFCKVLPLDHWGGYGDVPGYNFMIDEDYINRPKYFTHEIGHNILGRIDEEHRYSQNDSIHSKYPDHCMYPSPGALTYHPEIWDQIERDGLEGLPRLIQIYDWGKIEWYISY